MLRIYPFIIETIALLRAPLEAIERRDGDLARQLRRAAASVALNTAEGSAGRGKSRAARYADALGSARESLACLQVAAALGYTPPLSAALEARFRRIIGTLVLVGRRG